MTTSPPRDDPRAAHGALREVGWAGAIFLLAAAVSAYHYFGPPGWEARQGGSAAPGEFAPALFLASGWGFVEPSDYAAPELAPFFRREVERFDPASLPPDFPVRTPHPWDQQHRYLYYAAAAIWWCFGVTWGAMKLLPILLFAFFAAGAYAVFRHAGPRLPAAACALLFTVSGGTLEMHATVRDFSKGPFFLFGVFLIGCVLRFPLRARYLALLAAGIGAVAGFGAGFRQDLIMLLPPALIAIALGAQPLGSHPWRARAAAACVMIGVFFAVGWPVVGAYQGMNTAHDTIMGFSAPVDQGLSVHPADYQHLPIQSDTLIHAIQVHALQRGDSPSSPGPGLPGEIDAAGRSLVAGLITTYPADVLTRAYAAMLWVLSGGVSVSDIPPSAERPGAATQFVVAVLRLLLGFALPGIILFSIAAIDFRRALALFLICAILFGYLSIQFGPRHGFHLGFVPLWMILFLAHQGLRWRRSSGERPAFATPSGRRRGAALLALIAVGMLAPLGLARVVQHRNVDTLLDQYRSAGREEIPTAPRNLGGDWVLFGPDAPGDPLEATYSSVNWPFRANYLVARFRAAPEPLRLFVKYETGESVTDFTFDAILPGVPTDLGEVHYVFPIFENPYDDAGFWSRFVGVVLRREEADRFLGLQRLSDLETFPFWSHYRVYPPDAPAIRARQLAPLGGPPDFGWVPLHVFPTFAPRFPNDDRCHFGSVLDPSGPHIPDLKAALAVDPRDAGLRARLGAQLERAGDFEEAEAAYRELIAIVPRDYIGYKRLFDLHARTQPMAARLVLWQSVVDAHPERPHALLYLAALHHERGDFASAAAAYRLAKARMPWRLRGMRPVEDALRNAGLLEAPAP